MVLGPLLLGFGTIFQSKVDPSDHWSADPKVSIVVDVSVENDSPLWPVAEPEEQQQRVAHA